MWMGDLLTHYSFIHRFGFGAGRKYSAFYSGISRLCGVRRVVASTYGQTRRHVEGYRTYRYHALPFDRSSRALFFCDHEDKRCTIFYLSFFARVIVFKDEDAIRPFRTYFIGRASVDYT